MKPKEKIEIGYKFEGTLLTYLGEAGVNITPSGQRQRKIKTICDCGSIAEVRLAGVKNKNTRSCGCIKKQTIIQTGKNNKTHGLTNTPTYYAYRSMVSRCYNEKDKDYHKYGRKGIRVCERWLGENGVANFYEDMGPRPDGLTLDRVNSKGDYSPENCSWANYSMQSYNRGMMSNNTTGRTGVRVPSYCKDESSPTYQAYIGVNGKVRHLITTKDYDLAVFCREEAEVHFYGYTKE